ncbi:DUF6542 domain-containing protein [Corynebacterium meridianum]|uniref:DUF6542 domain-containing protein n=1 Tax=Corynebacterium meridianum TaxID=2765363 RepID=A0A934M6G8_9CORY|nr:DUF6542 domain-containing protein [Corynebacterium meridianum]MBI8988447.1 hypothetical protein [Corynebacterium meridianum]
MPQQPQNRSSSRRPGPPVRRAGIPTWCCPVIMILALALGTFISINQQQIGGAYLGIFSAAALGCTLFVVPRGLWLTTAAMPLMFGIATPVAAWTIARSTAAEGSDAFSATGIATAIYPLAQHFPILAATTVGCILIAVLRFTRVRQLQIIAERTHRQARRQITDAEHRNIATTSRARSVSSRARREKVEGDTRPTVAELRRKTMEEESARRRRVRPDSGDSRRSGGQRPTQRPGEGSRRPAQPRVPADDRGNTPRPRRVVSPGQHEAGSGRPGTRKDPGHEARRARPDERYSVGEPARRRVQDPREQRQREDYSEFPRGPRQRPVARPQRPRRDHHLIGNDRGPEAPAARHTRPDQAASRSPEPDEKSRAPQTPPKRRPRWLDDDLYS